MRRQVVIIIYSWGIFINLPLADLQNTDPVVPYAPEIKSGLTTPALGSDRWRLENRGAQYTGLLFAGRFEFNWLVDIRMDVFDQELWSVGNLVTSKFVLTTCRASRDFQRNYRSIDNMRVYFATQYLWEKYLKKSREQDQYDDGGVAGVRLVKKFKLHPKCSLKSLQWDTSIIVLRNEILPLLPGLGYSPIAMDPATGRVVLDKNERALCYVATFGRKTRTALERAHHLDFKIKYRVYAVSSSHCWDALKFMCTWSANDCEDASTRASANHPCFEVRARVGSICDHDRGAPIVCDGQVRGLVARGAEYQSCNTVLHVPFFALDLSGFTEYFERMMETESHGTSLKGFGQNSESVISLLIFSLLVHLLQ